MIRGYFLSRGGRRRPFIDVVFQFPTLGEQRFDARLLVDTGADRTVLAPLDARRLELEAGIPLSALPSGAPTTGVGGQVNTRTLPAQVILDSFSLEVVLTVLEVRGGPMPTIPSLLGRDILAHFALVLEERTQRVLLLEPHEADALNLS